MTKPSNVSHEQRVAWGHMGGSATAARLTPNERRLSSKKANAARKAKYSHEELSQKYAGCFTRILARMTPEQAAAVRKGAGQKRWAGVSPEERSRINRQIIQKRWAKVAYAKDPTRADRLFAFLQEYSAANGYSPKYREMGRAMRSDNSEVSKLLLMLEAVGRITRQPWGVTLNQAPGNPPISVSLGDAEVQSQVLAPPTLPRPRKCYDCDEPAVAGKTRCQQHLFRWMKLWRQRQARRKAPSAVDVR